MNADLEVRVTDADRERAAALLREHCVAGSLTLDELSTRLDEVYAARTAGELEAVTRGLPAPSPRPKARRFLVTLVGSEQRRGRWLLPRRLTAFSVIGAPDLDLRQAVIESEEVTITSFSLIGALTALVPAGLEVELGGLALIGGNDLIDEGTARPASGPLIRIRSFALIGGARVRRVSAHAG